MVISKRRVAAAVKRFPLVLSVMHTVWRLTRPRFSAGVIGVLFNAQGEVLIVEHVYHPYPQWGLPGGYVDRGEDPRDALAREFREELELQVEVGRSSPSNAHDVHGDHLDLAFLCHSDDQVGTLCNELLDYRWVAPEQLPEIDPFQRNAISQAVDLMELYHDNQFKWSRHAPHSPPSAHSFRSSRGCLSAWRLDC